VVCLAVSASSNKHHREIQTGLGSSQHAKSTTSIASVKQEYVPSHLIANEDSLLDPALCSHKFGNELHNG